MVREAKARRLRHPALRLQVCCSGRGARYIRVPAHRLQARSSMVRTGMLFQIEPCASVVFDNFSCSQRQNRYVPSSDTRHHRRCTRCFSALPGGHQQETGCCAESVSSDGQQPRGARGLPRSGRSLGKRRASSTNRRAYRSRRRRNQWLRLLHVGAQLFGKERGETWRCGNVRQSKWRLE